MQTVAGWPEDLDVATPTARVVVSGVDRAVTSVGVQCELGGSMPASVVGGSEITAADGTIGWADGDVEVVPALPWARRNGWPPRSGLACEVWAGYGDAQAKLITGQTTDTSGSFGAGDLTTGVEDRIVRLNDRVVIEPLLAAMPSLADGEVSRYVGLNACYYTDRALRACGFYATPKMPGDTVVSAPMNGSLWPERGECSYALTTKVGEAFPDWVRAPWGLAVQAVDVRYLPAGDSRLTRPLEVTLCLPSPTSGAVNVLLQWGTNSYRLGITAATLNAQKLAPSTVTVCSLPRAQSRIVTMRITPVGDQVTMELRTNTGAQAAGSTAKIAGSDTDQMTQVRATGAGAFGGLIVGFPTSPWTSVAHQPSAAIELSEFSGRRNTLRGMPAIDRTALDLLREQADAELAAMWIDAFGVFHWRDREVLTHRGPVATLTSTDSLLEAQWDDTAAHVRSRVTVDWREPIISTSSFCSVTVYQGSGETVKTGQKTSTVIHPAADEAWIMVDTGLSLTWQASLDRFMQGLDSWAGGVLGSTTNLPDEPGNPILETSMRRVDWNTYVIEHTVGTVPAGREMQLRTSGNDDSVLWRRWRNQALPIVRAKALLQSVPMTTVGVPAGPPEAEVLTHDAGWWVQEPVYAQLLADYLAAQTSVPAPTITSLGIVPDPRIELADVVAIDDRERSGLYLTALVVDSAITFDGGMQHTLGVRVITADLKRPELGDFDTVWLDASLTDIDTQWAGADLAALDADSLKRASA